ncbi:hypothetical protein LTR91_021362 [Friedmanniomyces endolithicus]|uniref:Uncharacterized protein n=1 Tax=Friedmanniomyces endolithicus TaxID=329885 RepID=A0AAN6H712_9PEZI|nr:hypothetical protein LTR94_004734 [Friedmanniomyces endolithicus]KAK0813922.1 hypothetical protein LTR59_001078 [Friedmanniomyces endolithicus]KAK0819641.1 hypothetical protein LTR38_000394 [Friedmanniomyces endolithicus]KAK0858321.1 hypothetical protein LTR03_000330 [Friedmanniomyces endolithicus]KAK0873242.1 hypothetical protein LTS02_000793 [Friedmanniomyces endolithicus]
MVVIGSKTRNGKPLSTKAQEAKLERAKCKRLQRSAPTYTNFPLSKTAFETPVIQHNRYAFGGPLLVRIPHPNKITFTAMNELLTEFNKADLHRRLDPLAVEALTDTPTICYARETEPAVFLLGRAQTFIKLQVKLVRESDVPGGPVVAMVRDGTRRYSLRTWLETLQKHRMPNIDRLALQLQHQQWQKTGRPFRFKELPAEIRSRIFLFAVGPYVEPSYQSDFFMLKGGWENNLELNITGKGVSRRVSDEWHVNALHKQLAPVNLGLLEISKATRKECMSALRKDTTKRYMDLDLVDQIPLYIPATHRNYIRRLELALTHADFIEMFHCQIRPFSYDHQANQLAPIANVLRKDCLPLLNHLELRFMPTVEPTYYPWASYEGYRPWYIDFDRLPCQKVLVDMILCFVSDWVRHIPSIELTGFIKTETKTKWERVLSSKKPREFDDYVESEKQAVRSLPDSEL